jgi:hypothetical protein
MMITLVAPKISNDDAFQLLIFLLLSHFINGLVLCPRGSSRLHSWPKVIIVCCYFFNTPLLEAFCALCYDDPSFQIVSSPTNMPKRGSCFKEIIMMIAVSWPGPPLCGSSISRVWYYKLRYGQSLYLLWNGH